MKRFLVMFGFTSMMSIARAIIALVVLGLFFGFRMPVLKTHNPGPKIVQITECPKEEGAPVTIHRKGRTSETVTPSRCKDEN